MSVILLSGCANRGSAFYPPEYGASENRTVYILDHGMHSGIGFRQDDTGSCLTLREIGNDAEYVEIGWGDEAYYPADESTSGMTMKAAFWPTGSVLHVAAVKGRLHDFFPDSKIFALELTREGFDRMCTRIVKQFVRSEDGTIAALQPGQYDGSYFYKSTGSFHLFNNCNSWTAQMLREAGVPISTLNTLTSSQLMMRAERLGGVR